MEIIAINREVQFQVSNATLSSINQTDKQDQKLDYLESLVLTLLVEKVNHLITYEAFLSHWRSSEATENSLSRVVSLVRKKLKQAGLSNNIIKNTAKKGYTLAADIELLSIEPNNPLRDITKSNNSNVSQPIQPGSVKPTISISSNLGEELKEEDKRNQPTDFTTKIGGTSLSGDKNTKVKPIKIPHRILTDRYSTNAVVKSGIIIISILITLVFVSFFYYSENKSNTINVDKATYIELLRNSDIKIELTYNDESEQIAFAKKSLYGELWQIEVRNRYNDNRLILREPGKNISKPAWLSKNEVLYRLYDENTCEIRKATLTSPLDTYSSVKLFSCNPNSLASSIAKLGKDHVLLSDAEFNNTASSLFIGDTRTGLVQKVNIDNGGGYGFYNVITSKDSPLAVLLSSLDGSSYKIKLVDSTNNWKVIWEEELRANNFSVGWDGKLLSYKNDNGGISVVSFDNNNEIKRSNIHTLSPTSNISATPNGLIMISGDLISEELSFNSLAPQQSFSFTKDNSARNKIPAFYGNNKIIYVSNKTGINQVWLYDIRMKESIQLSSFKTSKKINYLSIDEQTHLIAIQVENTIELYSIIENKALSPYLLKIKGLKPEFFDEKLIYSSYDDNNSVIKAIGLSDYEQTPFRIEGGFTTKRSGNQLYYSNLYLPGIWLYDKKGEHELILELPSNAYQWFVDEKYIYYKNDSGEFFQFHIEDKLTRPVNLASCEQPVAINGDKCLSERVVPSRNSLVILEWE